MPPGQPYDRRPSEHGDNNIEWRLRRLEAAEESRGTREEEWRAEVRAVHAQILTQQALTNQTLGHGDKRMDEIDEHLVANDKDRGIIHGKVAALEAGHQVLHAKVRSVKDARRDPKAFWTAVGGAVGTAGIVIYQVIQAFQHAGAHP